MICVTYAKWSILSYFIQLYSVLCRRKNSTDCDDALGCAVDATWFEEEYSEYNSVYVYRIRNFTDHMNGNYTLQCALPMSVYIIGAGITNYVRLVIPGKIYMSGAPVKSI